MDKSIMLTGDQILAFRQMALLRAMEFEVKTGMMVTSRAKANPFKIVREEFGIKERKKELVLARYRQILAAAGHLV